MPAVTAWRRGSNFSPCTSWLLLLLRLLAAGCCLLAAVVTVAARAAGTRAGAGAEEDTAPTPEFAKQRMARRAQPFHAD